MPSLSATSFLPLSMSPGSYGRWLTYLPLPPNQGRSLALTSTPSYNAASSSCLTWNPGCDTLMSPAGPSDMTSPAPFPPWQLAWTCLPPTTLLCPSVPTVYLTPWSNATSQLSTISHGQAPSSPGNMPTPCLCTREASLAAPGN